MRRRTIQILHWSLLFLIVVPYRARGQEFDIHPVLDNQPSCRECRIQLERTQTLAGDAIVEAAQFKRDSRGRFFMWSHVDPTTVHVFDNEGEELARIGRRGEGPGEFGWISAIALDKGPVDALSVYDAELSRVTVFDPWSFAPVATHGLPISPGWIGVLRLRDGRLVINRHRGTRETFGLPLHVLNSAGTVERSFGRLSRRVLPGDQPFFRRVLAEYRGNVVSISTYQFVIEIWNPDSGELIAGFERRPEGFRPRRRGENIDVKENVPPSSVAIDARLDENGHLWVLSWIPKSDWKQHLVTTTAGAHHAPLVNRSLAYNTVIDVIDIGRQQLVSSRRVGVVLYGWVDEGHVFSYREEDGLNPRLDVWRLTLLTP